MFNLKWWLLTLGPFGSFWAVFGLIALVVTMGPWAILNLLVLAILALAGFVAWAILDTEVV